MPRPTKHCTLLHNISFGVFLYTTPLYKYKYTIVSREFVHIFVYFHYHAITIALKKYFVDLLRNSFVFYRFKAQKMIW